jgi:hypothetical protein
MFGPMNVDSIDGCKSYVVFKDNYTCYQMIKCLTKKLGILNSFQEVVSHVHCVHGQGFYV